MLGGGIDGLGGVGNGLGGPLGRKVGVGTGTSLGVVGVGVVTGRGVAGAVTPGPGAALSPGTPGTPGAGVGGILGEGPGCSGTSRSSVTDGLDRGPSLSSVTDGAGVALSRTLSKKVPTAGAPTPITSATSRTTAATATGTSPGTGRRPSAR
jgi:hypothetical protein